MFDCVDEDARGREAAGLFWLLRLRWLAAAFIPSLSAAAAWAFQLRMPWGLIAGVALVIAGSNLAALRARPTCEPAVSRWLAALVCADVCLLTALLYFTGGAHNPFTVLYMLHITLAVVLLGRLLAWMVVFLCCAGFGLLFTSPYMLWGPGGRAVCHDLDFHLQGMVAATLVAGGGVVYFVTHLNRALRRLREENARAREAAARERHFSALITMAAGVSHELATPLGTIAVASRELELSAEAGCCRPSCVEDIRLIRREVLRCGRLLEKLAATSPLGDAGAPDASMSVEDIRNALAEMLAPGEAVRVEWGRNPSRETVPHAHTLLHALGAFVKNGLEASGPRGKVRVEVARCEGGLVWTVRDSGPGMPPDVLARLGEPFFSTKPPGSGMGLGIFLAKRLLEKKGAALQIECPPSGGTQVTIVQKPAAP